MILFFYDYTSIKRYTFFLITLFYFITCCNYVKLNAAKYVKVTPALMLLFGVLSDPREINFHFLIVDHLKKISTSFFDVIYSRKGFLEMYLLITFSIVSSLL